MENIFWFVQFAVKGESLLQGVFVTLSAFLNALF